MHFFITGGTGFIGSHLINEALKHNHKIIALKRNTKSSTKIFLKMQPEWLLKSFSKIELRDLQKSDVLIHLAAHSANVPYDTLENCLDFNVFKTLNLFDLAYKAGIKNYVVTGSCFEYGKKGEEYAFIPPDSALFPTQSYPTSKAASSIVLTQWALERNVSLKILRLFQVYGEGELKSRLWPTLKEKALKGENLRMTKGEQIRDFIEVDKVAKIILNESSNFKMNQILIKNIGSGKPKKLCDFVKEEWMKLNAKGQIELGYLPYRENEVMRYVPDIVNEYRIKRI